MRTRVNKVSPSRDGEQSSVFPPKPFDPPPRPKRGEINRPFLMASHNVGVGKSYVSLDRRDFHSLTIPPHYSAQHNAFFRASGGDGGLRGRRGGGE